ncbi:3'(2'),5'-bisphosphate nucleotidase CysQ [Photobacterium malacitanum]|uniref:3'(2'),5'-bisphosphate nucleotidase CysQ n=2 Tax=Photobacterium TaxID=657 RepID=A0A1Y6MMD2_9GAMM|nr:MULTISPECIES: 3'(2'),5'-bisphosphate nucleotidase CysQ [Photobacterium]SMY37745.1 3'(2'),5'-bisphosphate nucleotidase CysQ [Photobacterium andalusiense]SMY37934.1 3'(2'),5'-bisphosphate nucleotidase CysQ [Photobacterium malacitanum]
MTTLLDAIYAIALDAGKSIMTHYHSNIAIENKHDNSPVTIADLAANEIIISQLQQLTPDIPIISEESPQTDWHQRQHWSSFWLVDPLDGTKEFINKNGEFTVNIALVENGKPILAVVYAPALNKAWLGDGKTAWLVTKAGKEVIRLLPATVPTVVGSRSHPSVELEAYLQQLGEHKLVAVGSSLKFCLVAEGRAQYYPRLGPTMMWDTAAGQCIAESAGATVNDLDGFPLRYDRETLLNPAFVVS